MSTALTPEHNFASEQLGDVEARVLFPEPRPNAKEVKFVTLFRSAPLNLELGGQLSPVRVAYSTYGKLNEARDNAVLVCHALTGSSSVSSWWGDALGAGLMLDTAQDFIVCANVLGGCYGSTGPATVDAATNRNFGPDFPEITVGDMIRVQVALLEHLGISRLKFAIGGSMGGMQVLELLRSHPERVAAGVVIGAPPRHSAWALALYHLSRAAIERDPDFRGGRYGFQPRGLGLAREIATISYRSAASFELTQGRKPSPTDASKPAIQTYLEHQGEKLLERFDANSYLSISRALDRFDVTASELESLPQPILCVGISSDVLYLPGEIREIAATAPHAQYWELESPHGHDAFLLETRRLEARVGAFLTELSPGG
jgi:homoserine O-acetyltransferase/O-succinyltransferase